MTLKILDMHMRFYSFIHSFRFHELGFLYIIAFKRELSIELPILGISLIARGHSQPFYLDFDFSSSPLSLIGFIDSDFYHLTFSFNL